MPTATVVLVHGAFHGAWCWDLVVERLRAQGVPTTAVDLPGHGADPGPRTDLHGDAARVTEALDTIDAPGGVVLVGHSYGGMVVTEAGVHPAVRHVVYLAALAPDDGETAASIAPDDPALQEVWQQPGRPNLGEHLVHHDDGTATIDADTTKAFLYQDCDDDTSAWAAAHVDAQPLITMAQAPSAIAWKVKPTTYVVCAEDRAVPPELQRVMAKRCDTTVEWPTSHSPFASRPDLVAGLLIQLAGAE